MAHTARAVLMGGRGGLLLAALWLGACSEAHAPPDRDGGEGGVGVDAAEDGSRDCPPVFEPIPCYVPQRLDGSECCEPAGVASCVDGAHVCPPGTRMGRCGEDVPACGGGGGGCPEVPTPPCYRVYPDRGCCDSAQQRPMVCEGTRWRCPEGYATEAECEGGREPSPPRPPEDPPSCATIESPGACLARLDCVPVYDDACCPSCTPGPCIDCLVSSYRFDHCESRRAVCAPGGAPSCGVLSAWACATTPPDCRAAILTRMGGCSMPGCVWAEPAREAFCPPGDCAPSCEPLTRESCGPALCDRIPPVCPEGKVPLVVDGCYPSPPRCIDAALCGRDGAGGLGGFCGV